jgi:preprotein translocase subunit SecF
MEFLKKRPNIDFMGHRRIAYVVSGLMILLSIVSLATRGLNFGLDFTGGTLIEVSFPAAADIDLVRSNLGDAGLGDAVVQTFGEPKDIVVRVPPRGVEESSAELSTVVLQALQHGVEGDVVMRRVEFVGPQVGEELAEQGILAVIYAFIGIFLYVMMRFQWRFSAGSIAALFHDVIVTMGIVSVVQIPFDLTVVAAVLAVIGYSLNDTIVVFDRIRENFPRMRKSTPIEVINRSLNETLSRTLMTGVTTLMVLVALYIFGGEVLHGFSFTLIAGIVFGTYSSVYVASVAALLLGVSKQDLMRPEKEGADTPNSMP